MSRNGMLIALGVLIILAPISGLPLSAWRLLEVMFGACVFGIGISARAREARRAQAQFETPPPPASPSAF